MHSGVSGLCIEPMGIVPVAVNKEFCELAAQSDCLSLRMGEQKASDTAPPK